MIIMKNIRVERHNSSHNNKPNRAYIVLHKGFIVYLLFYANLLRRDQVLSALYCYYYYFI